MIKHFFLSLALLTTCLNLPAVAEHRDGDDRGREQYSRQHRSGPRFLDGWLRGLSTPQREKAEQILAENTPAIRELRDRIRDKMDQLERLSYDQGTSPETLPRLGRELQELRDQLRAAFAQLDERLRREVGDSPGRPNSRGCRMGHGGMADESARH